MLLSKPFVADDDAARRCLELLGSRRSSRLTGGAILSMVFWEVFGVSNLPSRRPGCPDAGPERGTWADALSSPSV
jgi:hypothetical protein